MADLIEPRGNRPRIGAWDRPLMEPNLEEAEIEHTMGRLAGVPVIGRVEAAYRQRFRLKSWQYMTAVTDELFVAFVVGTAGFAGNAFVYAVERATGRVHERFAITPLALGTRISPTSARGTHAFRQRDLGVEIECLDAGRRFGVRIDGKTKGGGEIAARLEFASGATDEHLAVCVPLPGGRPRAATPRSSRTTEDRPKGWNYTHKFGAFAVGGHVEIDGRRFAFEPGRGFGTMDFTKMYALRHAVWRWVAVCGRSTRGEVVGINLVDPTPDAPVSENAVWIGGRREPLAKVRLEALGDGIEAPWRVTAASVDLEMRPVAHVEQKLEVPLVRHRLRHVVGAFSGRVRTAGGQIHELESLVGIAEDNDTWW